MKKKVIAMLLATAMVASFAACGEEKTPVAGTETTPAAGTESVADVEYSQDTLTMVVNGTLTATVENGQADFEKQWEDAVGVDLVIKQLDHSNYKDLVGQEMLSMYDNNGKPAVDVIVLSAEQYADYASTGVLWDMTEAYANADFQSRLTNTAVNEAMKIDGKLYGFAPTYGNGCVTYVKKAWMDAVGKTADDIKTYDDYLELLRLFHNGDPDGNGVDGDTYGVVAAGFIGGEAPYINYLPEFWQDSYPAILQGDDGVWYDGFQTDATKAALQRIADAYAEGLINPASLTMGTKDARTNFWAADQTGSAGCFTYWAGTWAQNIADNLSKNSLDSELVYLAPLAEVGAYIDREAPVWCIIDDMDGDNSREQWIFDKFIETMVDGGEVQMLWVYGAEDVHWSTKAESFATNAGTEKETPYEYAEGQFHLKQSPNDPNTLWKKNVNDPALGVVAFEGEYATYQTTNVLVDECNKFFTANCKMAPKSPSSALYSETAGDITDAKTKAISDIVLNGVSVDDAMATYVSTVGATVEEVLAELNAK